MCACVIYAHTYTYKQILVSGGDLETQLGTTKKGGWKQDDSKLDMLAMVSVMCDNLRYEQNDCM